MTGLRSDVLNWLASSVRGRSPAGLCRSVRPGEPTLEELTFVRRVADEAAEALRLMAMTGDAVEQDLKAFVLTLKGYLAKPNFAALLVLLAAGGRLLADVTAVLSPPAPAFKGLKACPLPSTLADAVPALEAEANVTAIDWSRVLQIVVVVLRLLIA